MDPQGSLKTIQAAANVAQPGDTVLIQPGVYHESVRFNRSGTAGKPITFIGTDVVIDGSGFSSVLTGGQYITVKDLTVRNCDNGLQNYQAAVRTGTGWRMEDVTVEKVDATGICVMGNNVTLLRVIAQDNGEAGIGGDHCSDVYVKDCITRRNNRGMVDPVWKSQTTVGGWKAATYVNGLYYVDPDWEAGGGKWWATNGVTIDGMTAYDNVGPGIWFDYQNANAVVKNSTAYDNDGLAHAWSGNGIRMELSTQPILIDGNTVYGNQGPQIAIESCKNITVTGNTITGTNLALKDWPRGSTYLLSNITVTDNVFIQSGVLAEGGTWTPTSAADKSLTIDRNTYQGGLKYNWNYKTYSTSLSDVRNKFGLEWNGQAV